MKTSVVDPLASPTLQPPEPVRAMPARKIPGLRPTQPSRKAQAPMTESAAPAEIVAADIAPGEIAAVEIAPVAVTAPVVVAPVAAPVAAEPRPAPQPLSVPQGPNGRPAPISRASNKDETFSEGDYVVYPTHGVGKVEKIAVEDIAGHRLDLIHITFEENRMTLRVPVAKARSAGLRRLSTKKAYDEALATLKGRARVKRTMWSRRAQEYEAKINSGDPMAIAEVVRDLHRNAGQPDQSFSERQIYEAALDRMAAELGAIDQTDKATALAKLSTYLKAN